MDLVVLPKIIMPPVKGAPMNKLLHILTDPECYRENFDYLDKLRLTCPYCGNLSKSHGYYTRYYRHERIKIKRYYCKNCDKTWSLLPLFLLASHQV